MQVLLNGDGKPLMFEYGSLKTLTGLTISEALTELQKQLEPAAYKKVTGGGKELTDIKPAWLTEELTKVFGLVGVGWYYGFDDPVLVESEKKSSSGRTYTSYQADILQGWFIYRLTDGARIIESEPVRATGGSDNEVKEYAIRGALTNMLGAAASKLCWQLFIYKGEKEASKETTKTTAAVKDVTPARPWYIVALELAHSQPETWKKPLGQTDNGKLAITRLNSMVGNDGWWNNKSHMDKALKAYTGVTEAAVLSWDQLERLVRIYAGPHAIAGHKFSDVMYYHFCKPSEWQKIMAAIPVMEDMELTEDMADALNAILPVFGSYLKKGEGLDVSAIADNLRSHFVKLASDETVPPTSELVEEIGKQEELPY